MRKHPNLIKGIDVHRPEQLWVADITYIAISDRYCYLHLITDAYSKRINGVLYQRDSGCQPHIEGFYYSFEKNLKYKGSLIHHSDRGLQYCSAGYVKMLQQNSIGISMTEDGSPYDNAIAERVNGILKDEYGLDKEFTDLSQLQTRVKQSIECYNNRRPHESNHLLTPNEMHKQHKLRPKAWHKKSTTTLAGSCGFSPSLQY